MLSPTTNSGPFCPPCEVTDGSAFIAVAVQAWFGQVGVEARFVARGLLWENGHGASFNGSFEDELLNGQIFDSITEAMALIRAGSVTARPDQRHGDLGCQPLIDTAIAGFPA